MSYESKIVRIMDENLGADLVLEKVFYYFRNKRSQWTNNGEHDW